MIKLLISLLVCAMSCMVHPFTCFANNEKEKVPPDLVKIQISDSGMKPWDAIDDGESRKIFNTAVHGQALFINNNFDIKPGYIKSWEWDRKSKKFILNIDTSLKYHNGENISAYDFEFVLIKPFITNLTVTNDKTPLKFISGIDKLKPGMAFKSGLAEGIRVIDKTKIEISIPTGHTRFLYSLGALLPPMSPISSFKEDYYTFKSLPIGCGPYKIVYSDKFSSMVKIEKITNVLGPKYIEFYTDKTAFENGADIALGGGIAKLRTYMENNPGRYKRAQTQNPDSIEILTFNNQTEAANNQIFRNVVALAIDNRKEIKGFPSQTFTDQIIPILSYGYHKIEPQFDLNMAKQLWKSLPEDIKKKRHVLVCHGSPNSNPGLYYQFIYESLKAVGMNVVLKLGEGPFFEKGDTETTMAVYGRYIDIEPMASFAFYLPGTSFEAPIIDKEYEEIFKIAEAEPSVEVKASYISKMSAIIRSKSLVVPLHQRYGVYYTTPRIKSSGLIEESTTFDVTKIEAQK